MVNGDSINLDNQLQQVNILTPTQVQTIVTNSVNSALATYDSLRVASFDGESLAEQKNSLRSSKLKLI